MSKETTKKVEETTKKVEETTKETDVQKAQRILSEDKRKRELEFQQKLQELMQEYQVQIVPQVIIQAV